VYVFGCAFRSLLPRADVERICLFNTWLSSVLVGRSVATLAELCFAIQWFIILRELGRIAHSDTAKNIAKLIVPLIALAEIWSWYAVVSTNFLGNVLENSLWTIAFALVAVALIRLTASFNGIVRRIIVVTAVSAAGYVLFMLTVDVPMYLQRWQAATATGQPSSACLRDCTMWRAAGSSPTTSRAGARRYLGCRFISASRSGRASYSGVLA